jgi:hypothetical protein
MSMDYQTIEGRVAVLLQDLTRLTFSSELLGEGIRMALREYSAVSGQSETIAGLDEAGLTSIPEHDCGILVLGAAGYIAAAKTIDRKEHFNLQPELPQGVTSLGGRLLMRFDRLLGTVRSARLRAADVPCWGSGWSLN